MNTGAFTAAHKTLCERAGLIRLEDRTLIELRGQDRTTFLHNLCTNDVRRLQPGQGCEAFFCNVQGKIIGHALLFCEEDAFVLETVPGQAEMLLSHLDRYLIREDVAIADRTSECRELLVAGPSAGEVLRQFEVQPPDGMLAHVAAGIEGRAVRVRRAPWLALPSFVVQLDVGDVEAAVAALENQGVAELPREVFEAARIESGFPEFGRDITVDNLPQEIGRDAEAISFTKGCYLGQETVARIDALGHVNRQLVGLRWDEGDVPAVGASLRYRDKEVGRVTSACYSPRLAAPLALGFVRREAASPDTELISSTGPVRVVTLPLDAGMWTS